MRSGPRVLVPGRSAVSRARPGTGRGQRAPWRGPVDTGLGGSGARRVAYGKPPLGDRGGRHVLGGTGRGRWVESRPGPLGVWLAARAFALGASTGSPGAGPGLSFAIGGLRGRPFPPLTIFCPAPRRRVQPGHPVPRPPCGPAAPRKQSPGGNGRQQDGRARAKGALRLSRRSQSAAAVPSPRVRRTLAAPPRQESRAEPGRAAHSTGPENQRTQGRRAGASRPCNRRPGLSWPPSPRGPGPHSGDENEWPWLGRSQHRAGRTGAGESRRGLNPLPPARHSPHLPPARPQPPPPPPAPRPHAPHLRCVCQGQERGAYCRARGLSSQTPTDPRSPLPGELAGWLLRAPRLALTLPGVSGHGSRVSRLRPSPAHTPFGLAAPGTVPERAPSLPALSSLTLVSHPTFRPLCQAGLGLT